MLCRIVWEHIGKLTSTTTAATELLINVLDSISYFCKGNEANCDAVRHANGLKAICELYASYTDVKVHFICQLYVCHFLSQL